MVNFTNFIIILFFIFSRLNECLKIIFTLPSCSFSPPSSSFNWVSSSSLSFYFFLIFFNTPFTTAMFCCLNTTRKLCGLTLSAPRIWQLRRKTQFLGVRLCSTAWTIGGVLIMWAKIEKTEKEIVESNIN